MNAGTRNLTRAILAIGALLAASIAGPQALATTGAKGGGLPPKLAEVDYFKVVGEQGPATRLEVYGKRIDSLTFKASYGGDTATALGVQYNAVTSHRYGHPWVPDHDNGRRALLNVMKDSIDATGHVTLKVIAKNDAGKLKARIRIFLSACHQEPPIYPFQCTIEV